MATATFSEKDPFITIPGDRHSEVARTLAEPVPQALSLLDQFGLWGNLGVSLLGFTGAIFVLQPGGTGTPELSLAAALTAVVVGTVLGTVPLALAGLPGAQTGAPAMVLLRGLFGARLSWMPTVLNILQCLGWGIFELVTIATAAHTVAPAVPKWGYVLIARVATALLTIRPLGAIRVLRRYATGAVLVVLCYLFVQLIRHPLPGFTHGTWSGYWAATDTVVAVAVSFAPLVRWAGTGRTRPGPGYRPIARGPGRGLHGCDRPARSEIVELVTDMRAHPLRPAPSGSTDWRDLAACRDTDPELFFPIGDAGPSLRQVARAKQICVGCTVRTRCLEWALASGQEAGVWGGTSEDERRALRRLRQGTQV